MNRAIPKENSKLWVIFLTKMLIRLNWLFRWLCCSCWWGIVPPAGWLPHPPCTAMCPWGSHGWGVHTCLPRQMAASGFLSFYPAALILGFLWVPQASHCTSQFCWLLWLWLCVPLLMKGSLWDARPRGTVGWHCLFSVPSLLKWHQSHVSPIPLRDFGETVCISLLGLM